MAEEERGGVRMGSAEWGIVRSEDESVLRRTEEEALCFTNLHHKAGHKHWA